MRYWLSLILTGLKVLYMQYDRPRLNNKRAQTHLDFMNAYFKANYKANCKKWNIKPVEGENHEQLRSAV